MKISIVTPSLNSGKFVEDAILSVLNQCYGDFEHIIIDGGSTDNTLEVLKKYPHLIWISESDNGQSDAINKGLERATGDILALINSDDMYLSGAFNKAAKFFKAHPDADVLYGDSLWIDEHGYQIKRRYSINFNFNMWFYGVIEPLQPEVFYRKRAIGKAGLLDETFHMMMDREWWIRMAKCGCKFIHIPETLAALRIHDGQKSKRFRKINDKERWRIHDMYWEGFRFRNPKMHIIHWRVLNFYYRAYRQVLKLRERHVIDRVF